MPPDRAGSSGDEYDTRGESSPAPNPETRGVLRKPGFLVLFVVGFLSMFDMFSTGPALPSLQAALNVPSADSVLVFGAYAFAFAPVLLAGCLVRAGRWRRWLLRLGLATLTAGTAMAGLAQTEMAYLQGQVLQGCGAALAISQCVPMIMTHSAPKSRIKLVLALGAVSSLGLVLGQILGGPLSQSTMLGLTWRTSLLLFLPLKVIVLLLSLAYLPKLPAQAAAAPARSTRSGRTLSAIAVSLGFNATFGALIPSIVAFVMTVDVAPFPILGPMGVALLTGVIASRRVLARIGPELLTAGLATMMIGVAGMLMSLDGDISALSSGFVPFLTIMGAGSGVVLGSLVSVVLAGGPSTEIVPVGGVMVTAEMFANALGVAVNGGIFVMLLTTQGSGMALRIQLYIAFITVGIITVISLALLRGAERHRLAPPPRPNRRSQRDRGDSLIDDDARNGQPARPAGLPTRTDPFPERTRPGAHRRHRTGQAF